MRCLVKRERKEQHDKLKYFYCEPRVHTDFLWPCPAASLAGIKITLKNNGAGSSTRARPPHFWSLDSQPSPCTSLFFLISFAGMPPLMEPASTSCVATAIAPRIASSPTLTPA